MSENTAFCQVCNNHTNRPSFCVLKNTFTPRKGTCEQFHAHQGKVNNMLVQRARLAKE